jgi:hypothetical protein
MMETDTKFLAEPLLQLLLAEAVRVSLEAARAIKGPCLSAPACWLADHLLAFACLPALVADVNSALFSFPPLLLSCVLQPTARRFRAGGRVRCRC